MVILSTYSVLGEAHNLLYNLTNLDTLTYTKITRKYIDNYAGCNTENLYHLLSSKRGNKSLSTYILEFCSLYS